jgi:hypothetical protein
MLAVRSDKGRDDNCEVDDTVASHTPPIPVADELRTRRLELETIGPRPKTRYFL